MPEARLARTRTAYAPAVTFTTGGEGDLVTVTAQKDLAALTQAAKVIWSGPPGRAPAGVVAEAEAIPPHVRTNRAGGVLR
jgi:hypothetical protein